MKKAILIGVPVLLLVFVVIGFERIALRYFAWRTPETPLQARIDLLSDAVTVRLPENGDGPFPVVVQMHGCAGMRDVFHEAWADVANATGYAAMLVRSNRPRGLDYETSLKTVCQGKTLLGQERVADIVAALSLVDANPALDRDHVILAGWSHGAYTIMDYFSMIGDGRLVGLSEPASPPDGVRGAILFYPHCGVGARAKFQEWRHEIPVLAMLGDTDDMVDADKCIKLFNKKITAGEPVELKIYEGANHQFDAPHLIGGEYDAWYNEEYHNDTKARYTEFLDRFD